MKKNSIAFMALFCTFLLLTPMIGKLRMDTRSLADTNGFKELDVYYNVGNRAGDINGARVTFQILETDVYVRSNTRFELRGLRSGILTVPEFRTLPDGEYLAKFTVSNDEYPRIVKYVPLYVVDGRVY